MSLNRAMVIGNLGSDPVLRNLPNGQAAVGFSIATGRILHRQTGPQAGTRRVAPHRCVREAGRNLQSVPQEGTAGVRRGASPHPRV